MISTSTRQHYYYSGPTELMEQALLYSLDNGFLQSAVFLSEQLYHTDTANQNSRFLHGLCCLRSGQVGKAHDLTHGIRHLGCAYIYAQTCLSLNKYKAGIMALLSVQSSWTSTSHFYSHTESTRRLLPDGAAVACVLGHLYKQNDDIKKAIENYVLAVKRNPYLWEAFEGLLSLGVDMQVKNVFKKSEVLSSARSMLEENGTGVNGIENSSISAFSSPDIFNQPRSTSTKNNPVRPSQPLTRLDERNGPMTPISSDNPKSSLEASVSVNPHAPLRTQAKSRLLDVRAPIMFGMSRSIHSRGPVSKEGMISPGGQRRSHRITNLTGRPNGKTGLKRPSSSVSQDKSVVLPMQADSDANPMANGRHRVTDTRQSVISLPSPESEINLMSLLKQVGEGFYALSRYQCTRSIDAFKCLDVNVKSSPTVIAKLGRAYYENGNYEEAAMCFKDLRKVAPGRLEDMELYSTCLWHLHKEVELSYLAHEILDLDRLSPQAWCILANCFSLQREHDQALKCVRRAIQLDGDFAYAHTLEGHEFAANEEFEKAQTSFRNAIRVDKRHYNAWYGLGMAYMKTGNNDEAEFHFVKASQINPTNAVLVCCLGIVLERSKRFPEALRQYERACQLAPQNALARFKKAKALIMAKDYTNAMNDLHILKELAPDEANVHYLLGKMYRQFGDKTSAMKHLTIAMNLDNKVNHLVKGAIENMDELDNSIGQ